MAELSTFLYGISQVSNSHTQTPKDQMSTFSLHTSFLITSGAIQATVPAKLIFVLCSDHCLDVPKSLILMMSFLPMRMFGWLSFRRCLMSTSCSSLTFLTATASPLYLPTN